ncbi:MAG: hypothetical protein E7C81_05075 [Atopobium sp.]|nr:hypothetical protein [Atopobium sp.]
MTLAIPPCWRYGLPVTVNPVADLGRSFNLARRRPIPLQALFLRLHIRVMAAVRGTPSGVPGAKFPVGQPAYSCLPNSLGRERWQLHIKLGASPMTTRNPSKARASAHRAMALAALRSNSSLSVRLNRYNHHRAIQRALEAQTDACDWLENLEGDAWADACEEIAAALKAKEVSHA